MPVELLIGAYKQTKRLADAHRHHQNPGRRQHNHQQIWATHTLKHDKTLVPDTASIDDAFMMPPAGKNRQ
ncbi:MAG: hypothetical protein U5L02_20920 [Rheinheimera sp.]|nr:hypothetical protein [Rheinheimera sp.]